MACTAWMRGCLVALLVMLAWGAAPSALAHNWIERLSILQESGSERSIDAVRQRDDWRTVSDYVSLGFTASAVWVRIDLAPHAPAETLRLRIRPVYLDQIEAYWPDGLGGWSYHQMGDRYPKGDKAFSDTAFSLSFDGRNGGPIYLRVRTSSTMAIYPEVRTESDSERTATFEDLVFGVYFGLTAFLTLWSAITAWIRRDMAIVMFSIYLFSLTGMGLGITGLARFVFPGGTSDLWTSLFVLLSTLAGSLFHRLFLSRYPIGRWAVRFLDGCIVWAVLDLVLLALIEPRLPLMANAWLVMSASVTVAAAAYFSSRRAVTDHQPLLRAYALLLVVLSLTMLPVLGGGIGGELAIHLPMGHGLIIAVTLAVVIARQGRLDLLERQRLSLISEQARRELSLTAEQNQEYDRFLAMLTHELRNALGIASLVIRRLQGGDYASAQAPATQGSAPERPRQRFNEDPEIATSLARAGSALRSASAVLDKVQAARRFEQDFRPESSSEHFASRLDELIERIGCSDLSIRVSPDLALTQDWTYVELILSNLVENADRYRERGSSIAIDAEPLQSSDGGVRFTIANRLSAHAAVDPARVFDKYWRDPHAGSRRGAGLGLWLSQNAARLLGGELTCEIRGSEIVFCLSLPNRPALPA